MLILLPPSEGKTAPTRGAPLDLDKLVAPELAAERRTMLDALQSLSRGPADEALQTLGLPDSQVDLLSLNADLDQAPTAPAYRVYTGVLHAALDLAGMTAEQRRMANRRLLIWSGLFGVVRPMDRICAYRLSATATVPPVGPVARFWRDSGLGDAVTRLHRRGLLIDMRSGPYVNMWPLPAAADRSSVVKVWRNDGSGQKTAVSHHNKEAKGRLARFLATVSPEPLSMPELLDACRMAGFDVESTATGGSDGLRIDLTI